MENIAMIDTSVLIEYYRKKIKNSSFFYQLTRKYTGFGISVVSHYEILIGGKNIFFDNLFSDFLIFPYSVKINDNAVAIKLELKSKRKNIEFEDLIIAATAQFHRLPLATLNRKDFDAISNLDLETS
jgi:tRNA(fMet)-specific endonuclease VapC